MLRFFRSRSDPAPDGAYLDVTHDGRCYRVTVKRVARARRFTLKVRSATADAVLTMPARGTLRAARDFAERHAEWIGTRFERLPQRVPLQAGSTVPLRGVPTPIEQHRGLRAVARIEARLDGGAVIRVTGGAEQQRGLVLDLLRREARRDLEAAVARHAAAVNRTVAAITLRDTRSRWGSCTSRGRLNFSWRLVMAPPLVLDYLAAHEVAHLVHMDHSAAFWAVAERLAPDLAAAESWLKLHGAGLHRYG